MGVVGCGVSGVGNFPIAPQPVMGRLALYFTFPRSKWGLDSEGREGYSGGNTKKALGDRKYLRKTRKN